MNDHYYRASRAAAVATRSDRDAISGVAAAAATAVAGSTDAAPIYEELSRQRSIIAVIKRRVAPETRIYPLIHLGASPPPPCQRRLDRSTNLVSALLGNSLGRPTATTRQHITNTSARRQRKPSTPTSFSFLSSRALLRMRSEASSQLTSNGQQ